MSIEQILAQRGKTHGEFEDQARCAQELKEVWHRWAKKCGNGGNPVVNEAVDMALHKLARAATGALLEPDHWLDVQGYAKLVSDRIPIMVPAKVLPAPPMPPKAPPMPPKAPPMPPKAPPMPFDPGQE